MLQVPGYKERTQVHRVSLLSAKCWKIDVSITCKRIYFKKLLENHATKCRKKGTEMNSFVHCGIEGAVIHFFYK